MPSADLQPVLYCIFASLVWAPVILLAANLLDRRQPRRMSELIWIGALAVAILPAIAAPALSAFGVSLRAPAPELPPLSAGEMAMIAASAASAPAAHQIPLLTREVAIDALALIYIYGAGLALFVWLFRTAIFSLHVHQSEPLPHRELAWEIDDWRARLGVTRKVALRRSDAVSSVCVHGFFRPVILIPADLDARVSFKDLVMMGAHEIAHVKRGDTVFFALCALARVVFWFNPFVKRIASRAELAAEQSADQLVLEAGADRRAYAACFVEGLKFAAERAQMTRVAAPSFTPFDRKSRRDRLDAILSGASPKANQPSKLLIASAASFAAALAFAQAALAVDPETKSTRLDAMPLEGEVTMGFGESGSAPLGANRPVHEGVDIKAAKGTPILAPAAGVVTDATDVYQGKPAWGKVVVIRHGDGLVSRYAHLGEYFVKRGDRVRSGEMIAKVGATGAVTGPHLHFETLVDGVRVDPMAVLAAAPPRPAAAVRPAAAPVALPPEIVAPDAAAPESVSGPAPAPEDVREPAPAPEAPEPVIAPNGDLEFVSTDGAHLVYRSKDGRQQIKIHRDDAPAALAGGGDSANADMRDAMARIRADMEKARAQHAKALQRIRDKSGDFDFADMDFNFDGMEFDFDGVSEFEFANLDLDGFDFEFDPEAFAEMSQKEIERWRKQHEREIERARRDKERAQRDIERARRDAERAKLDRDEARREREEARIEREAERREAQLERAEAQRERELAVREAAREREEALREAKKEREAATREAHRERQAALREQARALAEAERDISRERERIEKMLADLDRRRGE